jgi:hypothetical protein
LTAFCVCVPARNEAARIGILIDALAAQDLEGPIPLALFVNNSCDDTIAVARDATIASMGRVLLACEYDDLPPELAHAGGARRRAMDIGAAILSGNDGVLISTDADCRPPSIWIRETLQHCIDPDRIVGGRILIDEEEALDPELLAIRRAIDRYWEAVRRIEDRIDPLPWDGPPRHGDHSGASLALSRGLYRRSGGVPCVATGEDQALVAAAIAAGGVLVHPDTVVDQSVGAARWTGGRWHGARHATLVRQCALRHPDDDAVVRPVGGPGIVGTRHALPNALSGRRRAGGHVAGDGGRYAIAMDRKMKRPIAYYVHHHGDGHRQRAIALAHALDWPVVMLGTGLAGQTDGLPCLDLPDDRCAGDFSGQDSTDRPAALHYAPYDHDGIRQRVAMTAEWIASARPVLMVSDVSVEMAMLARLASVPSLYVRLNGHRLDPAHRDAFRGALGLLAPFARELDDDDIPAEIKDRTFYGPGILPSPAAGLIEDDLILGVIGRGGTIGDGERWAAAARAVPERQWRVIGPCSMPSALPRNLDIVGWVTDPDVEIARASLVVGAAGDGIVGSVIGAGKPFICLPEPRPYDEQRCKAARLGALGAAIVRWNWPEPGEWSDLIAEALAQDAAGRASLADPDGAAKVAAWLRRLAQSRQAATR